MINGQQVERAGAGGEGAGDGIDLRAQLDGARLVVVGGTGFLGKVWLALLLHRFPEIGRVYLVVRAKDGGDSEARFWSEIASARPFDALREARPGAEFEAYLRDKVVALDADVTRPLCGFARERIAELSGTIDAVVNVAGVVDFDPPLDEALNANAFGVQNLVELARALGDVPVLHTSTAYVAGYRSGQIDEVDPRELPFPKYPALEASHWDPAREISECLDLVAQAQHRADDAFRQSAFLDEAKKNLVKRGEPARGKVLEDELARVRRKFVQAKLIEAGSERARFWGWTNIYTYTKSIGEQILAGSGLPYTLVRPTVIESSMSYPFPGWNEGINTMAPLIYLILKGHVQVPAGDRTTLDVIPVDMVAGAMVAALGALLAGRAKPVYQLGTSDINAMSMLRLIELCGLYKRKHFQRTGKGNPFLNFVQAHIEPSPVTVDGFYAHGAPAVARAARQVASVFKRASYGPAAMVLKPAARGLESYASMAQRNGEIWEMFIPFIAGTQYHFSCANMRALCAAMSPEDMARVDWRPDQVDWRHYLHQVHLPGLEKWVLPEIDKKLDKPVKPLRQHESLLALLDEVVERHDLAVAFSRFEHEGFTRVTFREVRERAAATAARLAAAGVQPGDRVVLSGANHPDWGIAYFGILRAGATAVPVDPGLDASAIANVLTASRARVAIWDEKLAQGAGAGALARVSGESAVKAMDLHVATAADPELTPPAIELPSGDTLASIIYTSGTTSAPKGVMLTHKNFTSLLGALSPVFPLSPGDRALSVLPLHHTFEFTCGFLLPLSRGARVIYLDELTGDRVTAAMREARVTAMVGVPALWQLLERRITAQVKERGAAVSALFDTALTLNRMLGNKIGADVGRVLFGPVHDALGGNIKYLISGGAALPKGTAQIFAGLGLPLAEGYGLTEAAPVLTVAKAVPGGRPGTVGKPIPGVEVKIASPDGEGVGEVLARGPNVMAGYADDPAATAQAIDAEGWLHTGDLGRLDKRGQLTIVGRSKDVIVGASGENVYPDDVERVIGEVPGVAELAIVGIADPRGGERVACLAVPAKTPPGNESGASAEGLEGEQAEAHAQANRAARERATRELRDAFAKLPAHQQPAVVMLWPADLPRTATRKVKRPEVRAILERLVEASAPVRTAAKRGGNGAVENGPVRAAVAAIARRPVSEITASTRLKADLGFDSLMAMELAAAIEAATDGRPVPDSLASVETVGELESALGFGAEAAHAGDVPDEHALATVDAAGVAQRAPTSLRARIEGAARDMAEEPPELPDAVKDVAKAAIGLLQREFYGNLMRPKVTGRAFIPHNRNTLVVANHASHLDMGLVKYALGSYGTDLVALAARDYFFERGAVRRTLIENFTNLAPIDRHAGLRESLREVGKLLDEGKTVLIFPEGTRSPDGSLREFKGAIGHLALKHEVDILPLYLGGTFEAMPKSSRFPKRRDVTARIGPPLEVIHLKRLTAGMSPLEAARQTARLAQRAVETLRDGSALDLATISPEELASAVAERTHPLVRLFDELETRFIPGSVTTPVSFYFTLGAEPEAKWTVRVTPTGCEVFAGKPEGASADCVLKTSPEIFTRIVREGYQPGVPEFVSGQIKSNDVTLLQTFQQAFRLG